MRIVKSSEVHIRGQETVFGGAGSTSGTGATAPMQAAASRPEQSPRRWRAAGPSSTIAMAARAPEVCVCPRGPGPALDPARDCTAQYHALLAQADKAFTPAERRVLRQTVVVLVRGYLAEWYRACGRGYLDAQQACCERLGARVIVGHVSGRHTAASNSATLFEQIRMQTRPGDRVILMAHSHGTLAALELLRNPAFAEVQERMVGFIPINGVFGGTPIADLLSKRPCMKPAGWLLERTVSLAGGEAGVLHEMGPRHQRAYQARWQQQIHATLRRVPVLSVATHYQWPLNLWDLPGIAMIPYRMFMQRRGHANDGCVPVSSQVLPGNPYVLLPNLHHAQTIDALGGIDLEAMTATLLVMLLRQKMPQTSALSKL